MKRSPRATSRRSWDRRAKRKRDARKALWISAGAGLVAVLFGVAAFATRAPELDPFTGCPIDQRAPKAHTIILIDQTDRLSRDELSYAEALVRTEYGWLPVGGRLTVRNIVADPDRSEDITLCRMRGAGDVVGFSVNARAVDREFQRSAGARLSELFQQLAVAPVQQASPILEFAASAVDRPDFGVNVTQRRLVIISDFAQHSDLASHYSARGARFGLSDRAESLLSRSMEGVEVRLQYVRRREISDIQGDAHQSFWTNYFRDQRASVSLGHELLLGEDPSRETWTGRS